MRSAFPTWLFTSVAVSFAAAESEPVACQCLFTDDDPAGCRVYGQLGDGVLIPWHRASQECLDAFGIKDQAIDPATLKSMFPNPDGTGGSASAFVAYLRSDDGSVASGIKASFDQFFDESTTQPGRMVFLERIDVDGLTYVCSTEQGGNEGTCWTALRTYFQKEPGASEMAAVGKSLYDQQAVSREKEQSMARIRLCSDGATDECGDLSRQVRQMMEDNPDKYCSAYGLGPAGYDYPICSPVGNGGNKDTSGSKGSSGKETSDSSTVAASNHIVLAAVAMGIYAVILA